MTYFEFIDQLAKIIGVQGKEIIWAVPRGGIHPQRPTNFELFWEGIHEGRFMMISKVVSEKDAPEIFSVFFSQF